MAARAEIYFLNRALGMVAFSAVSGGLSAQATGGDFWGGFITAATVAACNHAMHMLGDEDPPEKKNSRCYVTDESGKVLWESEIPVDNSTSVYQLGVNLTGAAGLVGGSFEIGLIWDGETGAHMYITLNHAVGGDLSMGIVCNESYSKSKGFNSYKVAGKGSSRSVGVAFFECGVGGDKTNNNHFSEYGKTYNTITNGFTISPLPISTNVCNGKTYVFF